MLSVKFALTDDMALLSCNINDRVKHEKFLNLFTEQIKAGKLKLDFSKEKPVIENQKLRSY